MNNYQRQKLLNRVAEQGFTLTCKKCGQKRDLGPMPSWIDLKAFITLHQKLHHEVELPA